MKPAGPLLWLGLWFGAPAAAGDWTGAMADAVRQIDARTPGAIGVYVHAIDDNRRLEHGIDRRWYLASTIKVPVAIAVLQLVEEGKLSLDDELTLARSDFVDGAGDLLWQAPGSRFPIGTLLRKSVRNSDSTATDMLIRLIGEDELNRRVRRWAGDDFGPITTLLQVRYDAYGLMHPGVAALSNEDLLALRSAAAGDARRDALVAALGIRRDELAIDSIDEAFARYYATGRNAGSLRGFGEMLRHLGQGRLLSPEHTALLLDHMRNITTGDRRIKAGLPAGTAFAQKTGTQLGRACNVGLVLDGDCAGSQPGVVVAACAEDFSTLQQAERAFADIGHALAKVGLVD